MTWYVIVRKDNQYPLIIYADKERADQVAGVNRELVQPVETKGPAYDPNTKAYAPAESK